MASDIDFVRYVSDQLADAGNISFKKMFGEYLVYVNQKPVVLICENTAFVKKLDCVAAFFEGGETGYPYSGAKEHYVVDVDNREQLLQIVREIEKVTPLPKSKKKKNSPGS
jgi:TfoX/Sxy family transcriptional regulator of competence genes